MTSILLRQSRILRYVIATQGYVLTWCGDRFTARWRENIVRSEHQHARLQLRLDRQRNVHCHLVAIEVGVVRSANERMNTNGLALNRLRSEVLAHVGEIETALALGADGRSSVAPYVQTSFEASLIPAIDSLRSLGIVWIPGLMAGMLLSGARPVYAAIYQFVVLAMIFASSGLTSLVSTLLTSTRVMSPAEQLVLRAEN